MCFWWCFLRKKEQEPLLREVSFDDQVVERTKIETRDYGLITNKYNFIIACFDNDLYHVKKHLLTIDLRKEKELAARALQIAYINENIGLLQVLFKEGAEIRYLPEIHQYKLTAMLMPEV